MRNAVRGGLFAAAVLIVVVGAVGVSAGLKIELWLVMLAVASLIGLIVVAVWRIDFLAPLLGAAASLPFLRLSVGSADFSAVLPLVVVGGSIFVLKGRWRRNLARAQQYAVAAVVMTTAMSVLPSGARGTTVFWTAAVCTFAMLWLVVSNLAQVPEVAARSIKILVLFAAFVAGYGLVATPLSGGSYYTVGITSLYSLDPSLSKNALSEQLSVTLPLAIVLVASVRSLPARILWALTGLTIGFGLLLTFSRGGWIAGAVGAAIVLRRSRTLLWGAVLAVAGTVVWNRLGGDAQHFLLLRLESILDPQLRSTNALRAQQLAMGWELFLSHPLVGTGLGAFRGIRPGFIGTFNTYLFIAVNTGLLGLMAFVSFVGTVSWGLFRAGRRTVKGSAEGWLVIGVQGAIGAYLVRFLTIDSFYTSLPWYVFGLAAAMAGWRHTMSDTTAVGVVGAMESPAPGEPRS